MLVFGLGLAITVAPLTAAVLAGVGDEHAGVASGVNNAVARVAGLLAIGVVGAILSAQFTSSLADSRVSEAARSRPLAVEGPPRVRRALEDASVEGFRAGMVAAGLLAALGGAVSAVGVVNPRRRVLAADCSGGAVIPGKEAIRGRSGPVSDSSVLT
jgi:hypothetical protein